MPMKLRYFGHSTFTIDTGTHKLIVDPFLAPNNPVAPVGADAIEADFILLTHGHGDHCADAVAIGKRTGALAISNFEIITWLQKQGVQTGHGMNLGGAYTFPFGRVKMTIAHHSSTMPDDSPGGNPAGFLIHFNDGLDLYIAGDTALTYDMKLIGEAGGVDLAILPMGDNFTMGPDDAVTAAQFVQAKRVIPCHYNTFPPIKQDAQAFAEKLRRMAEIEGIVLKPGEEYTL
ncbi:MAG: metal-dependent hydrolase [Chloroflexi bacterium]|nr:MAG: metal-dependent hydrolase [Chloroflexota bacterium]